LQIAFGCPGQVALWQGFVHNAGLTEYEDREQVSKNVNKILSTVNNFVLNIMLL